MSNHLAIATVSAVLRNTLQKALDAAFPTIPGARATTTRPNAPAADLPQPGVNIFLYQTTLSEGLRNLDLPRRRSDMTLVQRPVVALDLHYLFTFHGVEQRLEPEIMLGIATRALHEQPVMTRASIASAVDGAAYEFLQASDLLDALERTRVALVGLSLDELGRLWSIFYQIPYVLSAAYRASVVLLESDSVPESALPVRVAQVGVQASSGPRLDRVVTPVMAGPDQEPVQVVVGGELVLIGERLQASVTRVRFGDVEVVPDPGATSDGRIRVAVPAALAAGVQGVQVVHRREVGARVDAASNVAAFVLQPTIRAEVLDRRLRLGIAPAVRRSQRAAVLLYEVGAADGRKARSYMLSVAPWASTVPARTLEVPIDDVAPGRYLVQVRVDNVVSPLGYDDAAGAYDAPQVTIG
jgi:hypothetical protein